MTHKSQAPAAFAVALALTMTSVAGAADKGGPPREKAGEKSVPAAGKEPRGARAGQPRPAQQGQARALAASSQAKEPRGKALGHEKKSEEPKADGDEGAPEVAEARGKHEARHVDRGHFKSSVREARESFKAGTLSKEDLKKRLEALKQNRAERRERHREALKSRWGKRLAQPAAVAELRHHERRMAQLERMALLAETERQGADKDKLVARIEKLREQENERHERKMKMLEEAASTKLVKE